LYVVVVVICKPKRRPFVTNSLGLTVGYIDRTLRSQVTDDGNVREVRFLAISHMLFWDQTIIFLLHASSKTFTV